MKVRVWTAELHRRAAAMNGPDLDRLGKSVSDMDKEIKNFEAFGTWLSRCPDGRMEVWAGRWWAVSAGDGFFFTVQGGKAHCDHPKFRSQKGLDTKDFPGFFAFEAWKRAKRASDFYSGIGRMAEEMADAADAKYQACRE